MLDLKWIRQTLRADGVQTKIIMIKTQERSLYFLIHPEYQSLDSKRHFGQMLLESFIIRPLILFYLTVRGDVDDTVL